MSKELSPLEECEYLITNAIIHNPQDRKRLWVIHKELKDYERLKRENFELMERVGFNATYKDENEYLKAELKGKEKKLNSVLEDNKVLSKACNKLIKENQKQLKALKTIVAKRVDFDKLSDCCNYIEYNTEIDIENEESETTRQHITSEEYDMFGELGLIY